MMRKALFIILSIVPIIIFASHRTFAPNVKSLQVSVDNEWLKLPVMTLNGSETLFVSFDELSHNYHRFTAHLEHCEYDWSPSEQIFESDWLEGFNDWTIDDYENSLNTNVLYTNYKFQLPNDMCRLKMSGNYKIHILDEDNDNEEVACVKFYVVEPAMQIGLGVNSNTDIDLNEQHQQVSVSLKYNGLPVTNPEEQLRVDVMQNGREDNKRADVQANIITTKELRWEHNRNLIFKAGNEYHRFEVLDPTHITLGLEHVYWDQTEQRFHVFPEVCEPQRNYLFYQDADGAFIVRNSDNIENDRLSDYVYVHYKFAPIKEYEDAQLFVNGRWTTEDPTNYLMTYDPKERSYTATILQKMGYYNYRILVVTNDEQSYLLPEEGNFYQTENRYQAFVYYKETGGRTWRLVGFKETQFRAN